MDELSGTKSLASATMNPRTFEGNGELNLMNASTKPRLSKSEDSVDSAFQTRGLIEKVARYILE